MKKIKSEKIKKISTVDVAERAGVSIGTISRVLTGKPDVDPEFRKRVFFACRELNFNPRMSQKCFALVAGNSSDGALSPFTQSFTVNILREFAKLDCSVELCYCNQIESAYHPRFKGAVGIIFSERLLELRNAINLPIVSINQPEVKEGIHSVRSDHYQQGVLAAERFIRDGHKKIGFIENNSHGWGSVQRLSGLRETLLKSEIEFDDRQVCYASTESLHSGITRLFRSGVTALAVFSDLHALEAVHILTYVLKLDIPGDISVIAIEDYPALSSYSPPITVIRQPLAKMAEAAVNILLEEIEKNVNGKSQSVKTEIQEKVFAPELVERASVGVPKTLAYVIKS